MPRLDGIELWAKLSESGIEKRRHYDERPGTIKNRCGGRVKQLRRLTQTRWPEPAAGGGAQRPQRPLVYR